MSLMVWAQCLGASGPKSLHTAQGKLGSEHFSSLASFSGQILVPKLFVIEVWGLVHGCWSQLLWGCVAAWEPSNLTAEAGIAASSTFLLPQFSSHCCKEARGWDFVPCAELLQANSGSGVLSKLLMSLGSSRGVKREAKESLLPVPGNSISWHKDTGTPGSSILHKATLSEYLEGKQHVDCDWEPPELLKSKSGC